MRTLTILTIFSLFVAGFGYWTLHAGIVLGDSHGVPRAVLDFTHKDFGKVLQGDVLVAEYPIRNVGNRRLVVTCSTDSCCGGSTVTQQLVISPGETEKIRIEIDTTQWSGNLSHNDWIVTNDPELPRIEIKVTAIVM